MKLVLMIPDKQTKKKKKRKQLLTNIPMNIQQKASPKYEQFKFNSNEKYYIPGASEIIPQVQNSSTSSNQ